MKKETLKVGLLCLMLAFVFACSENGEKSEYYPKPVFNRAKVDKGFKIFAMHCQGCHGLNGRGAVDWRTPDAEGKYLPPPLNGTGHSWHHKRELLVSLIMEGTEPEGRMPGWKDKLSDEDVDNVITWFQSLWSPKVYSAWQEIEKR